MGSNKALLPFEGKLLWQRQFELLQEAGTEPTLISLKSPADWVPPSYITILDTAEAGPLSGLRAALHAAKTTHVIVLAVDLPRIPLTWLERLRGRCSAGVGAIGQLPDGSYEPLAAIYPTEIRHAVEDGLRRGQYALQAMAARGVAEGQLVAVKIAPHRVEWFQNWNSPEDVSG